MLLEDAEADGFEVTEPPDSATRDWSESQIKAYFAAARQRASASGAAITFSEQAHFMPYATASRPVATHARASRLLLTSTAYRQKPVWQAQQTPAWSAPSPEVFSTWFPGLSSSGTATVNPRLRILCFPNAGNAEDMYTSEGTGVRRAASPLLVTLGNVVASLLSMGRARAREPAMRVLLAVLDRCTAQEWCRANGAECLAVQPPGRAMRSKEKPANSAADLAAQLLPVVAWRLQQTPYMVQTSEKAPRSAALCQGYPYMVLAARQNCLHHAASIAFANVCSGDPDTRQRRCLRR